MIIAYGYDLQIKGVVIEYLCLVSIYSILATVLLGLIIKFRVNKKKIDKLKDCNKNMFYSEIQSSSKMDSLFNF